MRLASVVIGSNIQPAVEVEGTLYAWEQVVENSPARSIEEALAHVCDGSPRIQLNGAEPVEEGVRRLSPIPKPHRNLMCLGQNFVEHAEEFNRAMEGRAHVPTAPIVFTKATTSVCADGDVVQVDGSLTNEIDYEGELAVIVGRGGRNIEEGTALDHVAGYTILNDLTARDLQRKHRQWFVSKSLDGFGPMGPAIVTRDEIPNPAALRITTRVDGVVRQRATTDLMIFDIPYVVSFLSRILTLQVGDVIGMGTPKGVGIGFDPPQLLVDGSTVEVEITQIGTLRNKLHVKTASATTVGEQREEKR